MVDLNKLSRGALAAAMQGGTSGWGAVGSSRDNLRYAEALPKRYTRKACWCGCGGWPTHAGRANGVTLTTACEMGIARWVRTGSVKPELSLTARSLTKTEVRRAAQLYALSLLAGMSDGGAGGDEERKVTAEARRQAVAGLARLGVPRSGAMTLADCIAVAKQGR